MDAVVQPEKLSINMKRLIGELISGRDSAKELQILLHRPRDNHGSVLADELVVKILTSFSSVLSLCDSGDLSDQNPETFHAGSNCLGDRTSEEHTGESKKRPVAKDRRGYRRRKTSDTRIITSPTMEDGYAWRKYGQKEILNAKHPRCYFRCTHKSDQGCKANKQVQKLEDASNLYHITYFGHHSCRNLHKPTQMFSDSQTLNSYILNFEDSKPQNKNHPSSITNVPSLVKQEPKAKSEELSDNVSSSTLWQELVALDSSHDKTGAVMGCTFDHEDSCVSTDMDILLRSAGTFVSEFDQLDEMEFLKQTFV